MRKHLIALGLSGLLALSSSCLEEFPKWKWSPDLRRDNPCDSLYEGPPAVCIEDVSDGGTNASKDAGTLDSGSEEDTSNPGDTGESLDSRVEDASHEAGTAGLGMLLTPYLPDENCLALFHFDEPEPFHNACGSPDLINESTESTPSQEGFGQARHFNGGSYLRLPPGEETSSRTAITVEALVKPDLQEVSFTGDFGNIVTKAASIPNGIEGYILFVRNNNLGATLGVKEGEFHSISIAYQLPTDKFTHLAFTYDGSQLKLFIDGKLKEQQSFTGEIHYGGTPLRIGGYGTANSFIGIIDEVRISDIARPFSDEENIPETPDAGQPVEDVGTPLTPYLTDENCLALFHFDWPDYLTNGCGEFHNGREVTATPTTEVVSERGFATARHYDGESVIVYDEYPALNSDIFSIDALIRPALAERSYNGDRGWIVNKSACPPPFSPCSGYGLYIDDRHNLVFTLGINNHKTRLQSDYLLPTEQFTQIRGTYDGITAKLFIGGEPVEEVESPGVITPSNGINVGIGGEPYGGFLHRFIGAIDEVRISNVAREF